MRRLMWFWVVLSVAAIFGCGGDDGGPKEISGESASVYGSSVKTYAIVDSGTVTEVGVMMPVTGAKSAADQPMGTVDGFVANFPVEAQDQTVFDHLYLDFYHEGIGAPWDVPFFAMHFDLETLSERMGVTCPQDDTFDAGKIPAQYMLLPPAEFPDGGCVTAEGIHALDLSAPEMQDPPGTFSVSTWIGFDDGELAFIEPFVTTDFLAGQDDYSVAIRQPAIYPASASGKLFPTRFTITLDGSNWRLAMTDFKEIP